MTEPRQGTNPADWPADWPVPRVTVGDMLRAIRIERTQLMVRLKERVRSGEIVVPHEDMLKRLIAFHRAESFLSRCMINPDEVLRLLARLEQRGPRP